ncbi:hypothetical protein PEC302107_07080 [Pectobacterium araliae]|nr:hypothetical protein PEC302107_07080 [Pectobacterium carotovorum subsp. carotovorum]
MARHVGRAIRLKQKIQMKKQALNVCVRWRQFSVSAWRGFQ